MKRILLPALLACAVSIPAHANQKGKDGTPIVSVAQSDKVMNAAIEKGRATVSQFIWALKHPSSTRDSLTLKARFEDGREVEYIWLVNVTYDGKKFRGTISNEPEFVHNVKNGQVVDVPMDRVADWMYAEKGILVGGYTLRVLRDRMSGKERAELDAELPFKVK